VAEFAATHLTKDSNVGGYENTGWDLVFNMFGCTVAAIVIHHRAGRGDRAVQVDAADTSTPSETSLTGVRE
jgi:hypothetical protein